jgi:outer membrane lipoprotein LolB
LTFFAAACVLAGCATQAPSPTAGSQDELFRFGRFALKVEQFGRDPEAVQGGFTWVDTGTQLNLDLTNPFGTILARVVVNQAGSTLTRSNGEILQAATPDALVELVLGQAIPVQGLRDWLRLDMTQQALSMMQQVTRDPQGRVQGFEQNGWRVQRSRFDALGPQLLVLNRNDQGKSIAIRLIIDQP